MWKRIEHLLGLIRFSHTLFALPFALFSAILAWREPGVEFRWLHLLGILLCMVFARSAAMAFNRLIDARIDAENPRTARRHIPAGLLSKRWVLGFVILCSLAFLASTLLFWPNPWPLMLSVPVLLFLLGYSYAKRLTSWCHYWLSAALMLSPLAAWIALTGTLDWSPVLLGGMIFFWVGGFDILYACQDQEFDASHGLNSIPARWGVPRALQIALISHVFSIILLLVLWRVADLGWVYLTGVVAIGLLLSYEHSLVRPDDLTRVNIAFFHVNAVISIGLLLVGMLDVYLL